MSFWCAAWKDHDWFKDYGIVLEKEFETLEDLTSYLKCRYKSSVETSDKIGKIFCGTTKYAVVNTTIRCPDHWEQVTDYGRKCPEDIKIINILA